MRTSLADQIPILLGCGGTSPGVDVISLPGNRHRLAGFDPGHSVYAVAPCPYDSLVAAGSNGGLVVVFPDGSNDGPRPERDHQKLLQGPGLISLSWTDKSHLACSDEAGRVLWWDLQDPHRPVSLDTGATVICGLAQLDSDRLGGLGIDGRLFIWRPPVSEPEQIHFMVPPPERYALVRLLFSSQTSVIIAPGRGGKLAWFNLQTQEAGIWAAHEGDCYAIVEAGLDILSLGESDGRLKVWRQGANLPANTFDAPKGVIGASSYAEYPLQLLLINKQGEACLYRLDQKTGLQVLSILPGGDYRTAFCYRLSDEGGATTMEKIEALAMHLGQAARQGDQDEVAILRQRLIDLGYEHVSLALDVERALEDKNYQEALRHSHRLVGLLPPDEPRSLASLVRHVSLLAGFWQVDEAQRMWNLIAGRDHDALDKLLEEFPWLEAPSDTNQMIESPVKIEEMVAAANILGQRFGGNYLVNPLKRSLCDAEGISAGAIADAFNAEAGAAGGEMELKAVTRQYQHLSSQGAGEIQMVLFEDEKSPGANTIFALGLRRASSIMEIIPGFIFRWQANGDALASNNGAIKALHASMKDQSLGSKADSAFNAAKQIIRRAVTKARLKREV